ncbi:MAG: 30S ribosomal protein S16 [Candidatus Nealsonbacteria bacterium]|nr:30S ribosomal protein S16 [Candidatus Nealsonbacteria bacterium]
MLVIRLLRVGKKNQPSYKIVVTEKQNPPKGGRFVEQVGFYNPKTKEKILKKERAQYWISKGAQPSATVHNMLVREGVLQKPKISVHKKSKNEPKAEEKAPEAAPSQEKQVIEEKKTETEPESQPAKEE